MSCLTAPLLTFQCGTQMFALDATTVIEVTSMLHSVPVPGTSPWFLGLANLRGQIVHMIDTAALLRVESSRTSESPDQYTIIMEHDRTVYGLVVNNVLDLIVRDNVIEHAVPQTLPPEVRPRLESLIELDQRIYLLVNAANLIPAATGPSPIQQAP